MGGWAGEEERTVFVLASVEEQHEFLPRGGCWRGEGAGCAFSSLFCEIILNSFDQNSFV